MLCNRCLLRVYETYMETLPSGFIIVNYSMCMCNTAPAAFAFVNGGCCVCLCERGLGCTLCKRPVACAGENAFTTAHASFPVYTCIQRRQF